MRSTRPLDGSGAADIQARDAKRPRGGQRLTEAIVPDEPLPAAGEVPPAAVRGHCIQISPGYGLACTRCGTLLTGPTGRGEMYSTCDKKALEASANRRDRLRRFERGQHPLKSTEKIAQCRRLRVEDAEVDWLDLPAFA